MRPDDPAVISVAVGSNPFWFQVMKNIARNPEPWLTKLSISCDFVATSKQRLEITHINSVEEQFLALRFQSVIDKENYSLDVPHCRVGNPGYQ
ncbi:hypothetical protein VTL71DRAFT_10923 [Oculimacula yallundae]|uniref:Uncharacterized protein n=1 Tax=Oculimacula yallundae TaxID=86028 RepID=A0ABR4CUU0_9HELO